MNDITDFDEASHRIESSCALFQKGIYHLFILENRGEIDYYSKILRIYQCIFNLNACLLLLDMSFKLTGIRIMPRLLKRCKDRSKPTRNEIDPAALITHKMLEEEWKGFKDNHPLITISHRSLQVYKRLVEARHNVLYRPFMLANMWEDCPLISLLKDIPDKKEVENLYIEFLTSIVKWREEEKKSNYSDEIGHKHRYAGYFLELTYRSYIDRNNQRPKETLLLGYARLLNPNNEELLVELESYLNRIMAVTK